MDTYTLGLMTDAEQVALADSIADDIAEAYRYCETFGYFPIDMSELIATLNYLEGV